MLTALVQLAIVVLTTSVGLLADTIHNFSDALTAVPLFLAFRLSRRPSNRRYTYGYHRAEDLAGVFVILDDRGVIGDRRVGGDRAASSTPSRSATWVSCSSPASSASSATSSSPSTGSAKATRSGLRRSSPTATTPAPTDSPRWLSRSEPSACGRASNVPTPSSVSASRSRSSRCCEARPGRSTTGSWTRSILRSSGRSRRSPPNRLGSWLSPPPRVRWHGHRLVADLDITVPAALPVSDGHSIAEDVRHRLLHAVAHLNDAHVHVDPDDAHAHESAAHHSH